MNTGQNTISVVTVVRNAPEKTERTIRSVLNQDYQDIEFIIIDGGSDDTTTEIIKQHANRVDSWVSEPDKGPYDAMNKGISRASGEWILFLNAGDTFADSTILTRIFLQDNSGYDVIYGDKIVDYGKFNVLIKSRHIEGIREGMIFSHQSLLVRTRLVKSSGFQISYSISADYYLIYRLYSEGKRFRYYPEPIATIEAWGISHRHMVRSAREQYAVLKSYSAVSLKERRRHHFRVLVLRCQTLIHRILPRSIVLRLIRFNFRNHLTDIQ